MAQIQLSKLAHSYLPSPKGDEDFALKEIDHIWADGEAYALLGPSGCGKTTLLNIISGLLEPSQGSILFNGEDVTHAATTERNIAQVFQFPVVYDTMTVRENLAFPLKNRGADSAYIAKRVDEIAKMIGMEEALNRKARGLTADAKQKISLGRGMVREDVNAILFDEPLTVIDPHMKWALRTQLKSLHREFGHTMIYVTHDQTEAMTLADRIVVMNDGRVEQIGTPADVYANPASTFVASFFGAPPMNLLPAEVSDSGIHVGGYVAPHASSHRGPVTIGLRPERAHLNGSGAGIHVDVGVVEELGAQRLIHGRIGEHELTIAQDAEQPVPEGRMALDFRGEDLHLFHPETGARV